MRMIWGILALACVALVVPGVNAEAGGKGAVKTDLLLAEYPNDRPPSEVVLPEVDVGNVVFNTTTDDRMAILVQLKDAVPGMTYRVFAVPLDDWGPGIDQAEITTDRFGNGTLRFSRPIPDGAEDPVEITLIVRKEIPDPERPDAVPRSRRNWIVYKTRAQSLRLK